MTYWPIMSFLLWVTATEKKNYLIKGATLMLRYSINKPYPGVKAKKISLRIAMLSILILVMVVFIAYRCMMNAFLAAQTFVLPINNYDEMLKSNFKLIMARGTTYEDLYKYAQEVST